MIYCALIEQLKIKCSLTFNITNNSLRMLPFYFSLKPYISRLQPSGKCLDLFVVVVVVVVVVSLSSSCTGLEDVSTEEQYVSRFTGF